MQNIVNEKYIENDFKFWAKLTEIISCTLDPCEKKLPNGKGRVTSQRNMKKRMWTRNATGHGQYLIRSHPARSSDIFCRFWSIICVWAGE